MKTLMLAAAAVFAVALTVGTAAADHSSCAGADLSGDGAPDCVPCNNPSLESEGRGCVEDPSGMTDTCAGGNPLTLEGCVCVSGVCQSMGDGAGCAENAAKGCSQL